MPSKSRVLEDIDKIDKQSLSISMVKYLINSINVEPNIPMYFKKGDIILNEVGYKRPCVVIKVEKDFLLTIPLSTTKDCLNLCKYKSRFLRDGFYSKSIVAIKTDYARNNFIGIFDN